MQYLAEYGLFFAKLLTLALIIVAAVAAILALVSKNKHKPGGRLEVSKLNDKYKNYARAFQHVILDEQALKKFLTDEKKQEKKSAKARKTSQSSDDEQLADKKKLFVIDFDGDLRASAVASLREEITAILLTATPQDEVVLRIESPGGVVHGYGLAASQLQRLRAANIPLTVTIDKVAASGGYLMACVANKILAAPFAIVGSIGVLAQLPNFHRLLNKHAIDFEQLSAGEYKRTLSLFGENTRHGREKVQEEIDATHELFKQHIAQYRPNIQLNQVATGEHWYGQQAIERALVDQLITSDDYLLSAKDSHDIYQIHYRVKQPVTQKLFTKIENAYLKLTQPNLV